MKRSFRKITKRIPELVTTAGVVAIARAVGSSDYAAEHYLAEPSWVGAWAWTGLALIGIGVLASRIRKERNKQKERN